jgi:hypothetical protein
MCVCVYDWVSAWVCVVGECVRENVYRCICRCSYIYLYLIRYTRTHTHKHKHTKNKPYDYTNIIYMIRSCPSNQWDEKKMRKKIIGSLVGVCCVREREVCVGGDTWCILLLKFSSSHAMHVSSSSQGVCWDTWCILLLTCHAWILLLTCHACILLLTGCVLRHMMYLPPHMTCMYPPPHGGCVGWDKWYAPAQQSVR